MCAFGVSQVTLVSLASNGIIYDSKTHGAAVNFFFTSDSQNRSTINIFCLQIILYNTFSVQLTVTMPT